MLLSAGIQWNLIVSLFLVSFIFFFFFSNSTLRRVGNLVCSFLFLTFVWFFFFSFNSFLPRWIFDSSHQRFLIEIVWVYKTVTGQEIMFFIAFSYYILYYTSVVGNFCVKRAKRIPFHDLPLILLILLSLPMKTRRFKYSVGDKM